MKKIAGTKLGKTGTLGCLLLLCCLGNTGWCGKIVYPWRATTAIVKVGESFDVWFAADASQTVTNVVLVGPYNTVNPTMSPPVTGSWVYDQNSGNSYNTRITVTIPPDAPADRYNLILKTSTGDETSFSAVKVIKEYKENYYIAHLSDVHRWQGGYNVTTSQHKVSAIITIADIMDTELIFETGDHLYCHTTNPGVTSTRVDTMFVGMPGLGIKGLYDANAATFIVPGNHDSPSNDYTQDASRAVTMLFYNNYYGLQSYQFTYGNGRFMGVNSGMGPVPADQRTAAAAWLSSAGSGGNFRMTAGHAGQGAVSTFEAATQLNLILVGHNHYLASSNALDVNGKLIQYVANAIRDTGTGNFEYNLFRVNNSNGTYEVLGSSQSRVHVIQNHTVDSIANPAGWIPMLELNHSEPNDGSQANNTATFINRYNFPIYGAKVRFVMPLGSSYGISQGVISQEFDGDSFHIVDVHVDLSAASTTSVDIFSTSVAANNAQFILQEVPESLEPGETATVRITMKNTGTNTWSAAAGHQLGSQSPPDNALWTGTNRVSLSGSVSPGNTNTFVFDITAPDVPGNYDFQWKMVDDVEPDSGWFGQSTLKAVITVAEVLQHGDALLAVDLHQNSTDPVPETPDYFVGWMIGNVSAGVAAPSTNINGYTVTVGTGTSIGCLTNPSLQNGCNARNRITGYIQNAGLFTQADLMRERIASLLDPTDPSTGNGKGNGIYLKISGLVPDTPYVLQAWGVDSTGTNPNATLKNGYNYGFDATRETSGYSSLPLLGSYTVSGSPSVITDNNQYSVMGTITADASGLIIYKQISNIDKSVMNGFVLYSAAGAEPSGYERWASTNGITGGPTDDDDGDGLNNLSEYAVSEKPALVQSGDTFDYVHLQRNDDPALIYSVETTTNLISGVWTNAGGTVQTNVTGGVYDEVTHRILADKPQAYIRLKITDQ